MASNTLPQIIGPFAANNQYYLHGTGESAATRKYQILDQNKTPIAMKCNDFYFSARISKETIFLPSPLLQQITYRPGPQGNTPCLDFHLLKKNTGAIQPYSLMIDSPAVVFDPARKAFDSARKALEKTPCYATLEDVPPEHVKAYNSNGEHVGILHQYNWEGRRFDEAALVNSQMSKNSPSLPMPSIFIKRDPENNTLIFVVECVVFEARPQDIAIYINNSELFIECTLQHNETKYFNWRLGHEDHCFNKENIRVEQRDNGILSIQVGLAKKPATVSQSQAVELNPPVNVNPKITVQINKKSLSGPFSIRGSGPGMDNWNAIKPLSQENGALVFDPGIVKEPFQFKIVTGDGNVWENGNNHTFVPGQPMTITTRF